MTAPYLEVPCGSGDMFRIRIKELVYRARSAHQVIEVYDTWEFGRCLVLDGVIQASERDHEIYDRQMLARMRPSDRELLILGGGDGYVAELAVRTHPEIAVTIVDLDRAVAEAAAKYMSQRIFDHPAVRLVVQDALVYMPGLDPHKFDGLVCDFTDVPVGYDEQRFRDFYSGLLGHASRVLKEEGWMSVYAGIQPGRILDLCAQFFPVVQRSDILVPSFGEPCTVIFCEGRIQSPDRAG